MSIVSVTFLTSSIIFHYPVLSQYVLQTVLVPVFLSFLIALTEYLTQIT